MPRPLTPFRSTDPRVAPAPTPQPEEDAPDFEALRRERNEGAIRSMQKLADEHGIPLQSLRSNFNPNACYCACPGPCEHKWDGEWWTSEDGCAQSATCSRCGCTAMSHDVRVLP
jgi:hypothetical protein